MDSLSKEDFYREWLVLLEGVIDELISKINIMRKFAVARGYEDPVEHCKGRVKSPDSMIAKLIGDGFEATAENAVTKVFDAAGVRVVCPFVDDVYTIAEMIKKQPDINVLKEKDYIKFPKPSGYRSYHMIVCVPMVMGDETINVNAEIQIRTISMDCWASLEHQLRYKHDISKFEFISGELKRCADEIASTEINFKTIRDMINSVE